MIPRRRLGLALTVLVAAGCGSSAPHHSQAASTTTTTSTSTTNATSTVASSVVASSTTTSRPGAPATSSTVTTAPTTTSAPPPRTVTAGPNDNGRTLRLRVGDTLQITLSGCGGCGYQWEMTGQPNAAVFRYQGESTSSSSTTSTTAGQGQAVGSPLTYTWTFTAISAHTTAFRAGYYPPGQQSPTQTYSVTLTVSG